MHEKLIVHRDLKPENIFLDQDYNIKIGDFGLSVALENKDELLHTFCGTLKYQAPEMIERKGYNFSVDVWALGCILYRLYYGNAPFDGQSSEQIYKAILTKNVKFPRLSKNGFSIQTYDITMMKSILHKDASLRKKLDKLLEDKKYFSNNTRECNNKQEHLSFNKKTSIVTLKPLSISKKLETMLACMNAISNCEPNERIHINYSMYHNYKLMPKYWIIEWIDINLFGFGYLFNKNIYGFNFKKNVQRMMLLNGQSVVYYEGGNNKCQSFTMQACPNELSKNFRILKKSHSLLIEQITRENRKYPEMEINLSKSNLPWLHKKIFIENSQMIAMVFHFQSDLIQINFVENQKIFLFDAQSNSITIIKNDNFLCLSLEFILGGHINDVMQSYISECLKYINLLLKL